ATAPGEDWIATVVEPVSFQAVSEEEPKAGPYLLDSGDHVRVTVYGEPTLSRVYIVDPNGKFSVPLAGTLNVRGKTTTTLDKVITAKLAAKYVKNPHVTVNIARNRPFYILGEVRNAGQYPYAVGMTIESAVATAGGYKVQADQSGFRLTRTINGQSEQTVVSTNFAIRPGDSIYVKKSVF
ncbi:MAG: polysaccharide biosynthesis/export family protein, partial [Hyphomicrobiaceae bacterium]